MESHEITLASKPGASLRIRTYPSSTNMAGSPPTLIVFLNGLIIPQSSWQSAIDILVSQRPSAPAILTYDRYGQGDSDPDPTDPPDTVYGHNAETVISDLHQLLLQVSADVLHIPPPGSGTRLIIVANSIGCPLARLYAAKHPETVAAYLFLDSMMANTDFVSLFPDPDAADFDPDVLPDGVSVEDIRHARGQYGRMFRPSVPNREHFDRRDLRSLLPHAERPLLPHGPDGRRPLVTVVGHDWDVFAQQSLDVSRICVVICFNGHY
jgi:pimeloyl-ACP methyl ester carboxylesterase